MAYSPNVIQLCKHNSYFFFLHITNGTTDTDDVCIMITDQKGDIEICTHQATGVANPSQFWGDVLPDADAALSNALACCELQEEQGHPDDHHQQYVEQQKGP